MFKLLIVLLVSASFASAIGSTIDLTNLLAFNSSGTFQGTDINYMPLAAHGNTIVTFGMHSEDDGADLPSWLVFRELNGQIVLVANVTASTDNQGYTAVNNGKWMGGVGTSTLTLFQLDADDNPVNITSLPVESISAFGLLSDSTLVYWDNSESQVASLQPNASGIWSPGPSFTVTNPSGLSYPNNAVLVEENFVVVLNGTYHAFIYTRQAAGGWVQTDSFQVNTTYASGSPLFMYSSGNDTIVFAIDSMYPGTKTVGYMFVYTKVNGVWQQQTFTSDQLGFSYSATLGVRSFAKIDQNNFVIGAANDGSPCCKRAVAGTPDSPFGSVILFQRQENHQWAATAKIASNNPGGLGLAVTVTDSSIVMAASVAFVNLNFVSFATLPLCIVQPINATCSQVESDSCQFNSDSSSLYSVQQCAFAGLEVTASLNSVVLENSALNVEIDFNRPLSPTYTCNATVTCTRTPTNVPVAAPNAKVSGAATLVAGLSLASSLVALF